MKNNYSFERLKRNFHSQKSNTRDKAGSFSKSNITQGFKWKTKNIIGQTIKYPERNILKWVQNRQKVCDLRLHNDY